MAAVLSTCEELGAHFVAEACGGALRGSGSARRVATDTRSRGDLREALFVALRGERFDAHEHLQAALDGGARGLLIEGLPAGIEVPDDVFVVLVDDTRAALGELARAYRQTLRAKVVGITGSCGKTSTKEIAQFLLAPQLELVASEKSYNNEIGVPLTLLRAGPETEVVLVEIGTNGPGEIAALTDIADPDVALVTMIGRGHLEGLRSVEGVLREKSELLARARPDGFAIVNADDAKHRELRAAAQRRSEGPVGRRVLSFGTTHEATLRARHLRSELRADGSGVHTDFEFELESRATCTVSVPRAGQHDVRNLLAALAIGHALGADIGAMLARVAELPPTPRRLEFKRARSGVRILDDSYNANPESVLAALSVLDRVRDAQRRVLVLGDMRELGEGSEALHEELGEAAVGRVEALVAVGPLAAIAGRAFARSSGCRVAFFDSLEQLMPELDALFAPEDLVLFKGSRALQLDRAVDAMTAP